MATIRGCAAARTPKHPERLAAERPERGVGPVLRPVERLEHQAELPRQPAAEHPVEHLAERPEHQAELPRQPAAEHPVEHLAERPVERPVEHLEPAVAEHPAAVAEEWT